MSHEAKELKEAVRERYAAHATEGTSCCGPATGPGACSCTSETLGYSPEELASLPVGADLGLGCGNPLAFAALREGETVLDLGSGGGIDCLLAAKRVGPTGHVIGVDMTPEMLQRARDAAERGGFANVEFRQGDLESLPVEDCSVDVVISNCVINLVPDKAAAIREAFRVLKPGGRLEVSDIVLTGEMPDWLGDDLDAHAACLAGAIPKTDYLGLMFQAGFSWVGVSAEHPYAPDLDEIAVVELAGQTGHTSEEIATAAGIFSSVQVSALKGEGASC